MTQAVLLYGMSVTSEIPLHQTRPVPDAEASGFHIGLGASMDPTNDPPPGRVLLDLSARRQYYTGSETGHGYLLRFYGTCDVRVATDLRDAVIHPVVGVDPAVLSVLAGGTLLAFVLGLKGIPVLHASAVESSGAALAFTGGSGMGKSTLATLLCASGAKLITDDLLCLELDEGEPTCLLGATELRLRKSADELAALFLEAPPSRTTGDARSALSIEPAVASGLPLRAIIIPLPDKLSQRSSATIEPLDAKAAFMALNRFPRLLGWQAPEILERQFQQLGEIVDAVPVYVGYLPWGPPFPALLATQLRQVIEPGFTSG